MRDGGKKKKEGACLLCRHVTFWWQNQLGTFAFQGLSSRFPQEPLFTRTATLTETNCFQFLRNFSLFFCAPLMLRPSRLHPTLPDVDLQSAVCIVCLCHSTLREVRLSELLCHPPNRRMKQNLNNESEPKYRKGQIKRQVYKLWLPYYWDSPAPPWWGGATQIASRIFHQDNFERNWHRIKRVG